MTHITLDSHGTPIQAELFAPAEPATGRAIVVAHGSDGMLEPWGSVIRQYAQDLAARGFLTLIPSYFDKTGTAPGMHVFSELTHLTAWVQTVGDACVYAQTATGARGRATGLLGFSLGGAICLRLRGTAATLVEFFAPELPALGSLGPISGPERPAVQIHHGLADMLVPFAESQQIVEGLRAEGLHTELFAYEAAGHGFVGDDAANATASRVSHDRTLAFFKQTLLGT